MSATTTSTTNVPTGPLASPVRPAADAVAGSGATQAESRAHTTAIRHEPTDLHDLAHLLAAPIDGAARRAQVDLALDLLLGPDGADAAYLRPGQRTPDVVRHRIAGRALARLDFGDARHRQLMAGALAILRP